MPERTCPTPWKVAYPTRFAAQRAATSVRGHRRDPGVAGHVKPYACEAGGHFHVGHRAERPR